MLYVAILLISGAHSAMHLYIRSCYASASSFDSMLWTCRLICTLQEYTHLQWKERNNARGLWCHNSRKPSTSPSPNSPLSYCCVAKFVFRPNRQTGHPFQHAPSPPPVSVHSWPSAVPATILLWPRATDPNGLTGAPLSWYHFTLFDCLHQPPLSACTSLLTKCPLYLFTFGLKLRCCCKSSPAGEFQNQCTLKFIQHYYLSMYYDVGTHLYIEPTCIHLSQYTDTTKRTSRIS